LCKCINEMKKTRIFILKSVGMKTDKCLLFLNTKYDRLEESLRYFYYQWVLDEPL